MSLLPGFAAGLSKGEIPPQAPDNTVDPAVSPSSGVIVGTTLTCSVGSWDHNPDSYAYQWQHYDGVSSWPDVSGQTSSSIVSGLGWYRCRVTASNEVGTGTAFSNAVEVVSGE